MNICIHCHRPCTIVDDVKIEVSEFWGAREVREVTYAVSDCCAADVEDAPVTEGEGT